MKTPRLGKSFKNSQFSLFRYFSFLLNFHQLVGNLRIFPEYQKKSFKNDCFIAIQHKNLQINRCFEFQLSRVSLVPCFAFGENDLYDQIDNPEGSLLKFLQKRLTKVFGFSMPLFRGRGVFNYTFGILPRRRPITTVSK